MSRHDYNTMTEEYTCYRKDESTVTEFRGLRLWCDFNFLLYIAYKITNRIHMFQKNSNVGQTNFILSHRCKILPKVTGLNKFFSDISFTIKF